MSKGSSFERSIAVYLSNWWTHNTRDDIFWRSTTSGARATSRSKQGKRTAQMYGDICAIDAIGDQLISTITFELKRGYSTRGIHDLLDHTDIAAYQTWEGFIAKAHKSHQQAGSVTWALITSRTYRTTWVWFPWSFIELLRDDFGLLKPVPKPCIKMSVNIRKNKALKKDKALGLVDIFGCQFDNFFDCITPEDIKKVNFVHG